MKRSELVKDIKELTSKIKEAKGLFNAARPGKAHQLVQNGIMYADSLSITFADLLDMVDDSLSDATKNSMLKSVKEKLYSVKADMEKLERLVK